MGRTIKVALIGSSGTGKVRTDLARSLIPLSK
jgi:hypothetical protein